MISVYCKCGKHFTDGDAWRVHLGACKVLRECLVDAPSIDIQYPDLGMVPAQLEKDIWEAAEMPTWKLPARVTLSHVDLSNRPKSVVVYDMQFAFLWALVIATQQAVPYQLRVSGMSKCWRGGVQAQKALIALLRLVPNKDYSEAIREFVTKIA